jgi:hypothetical protein
VAAVAGLVIVSAAAAAPTPVSIATSSGKGATVRVSSGTAGEPSRFRVVVTTKPAGLPVVVDFQSERRTGKSPMTYTRTCDRCSVRVVGRLKSAGGGAITIAIYRMRP